MSSWRCSSSAVAACTTAAQAGAATVRGFNGKTITIGGIWSTANFSGAQIGAQGYINQINKTNYLHGIKLKFAGYVNDGSGPGHRAQRRAAAGQPVQGVRRRP